MYLSSNLQNTIKRVAHSMTRILYIIFVSYIVHSRQYDICDIGGKMFSSLL